MNKGELRETVAKETGLTGADAERAVDAALSARLWPRVSA